jgi:hypothetical protein
MANFMVAKSTKRDGEAQTWSLYIQRPNVSATVWDDSGMGTHKSAMLMRAAARGRYGVENFKRSNGRGSAVYYGSNKGEALPVAFIIDSVDEVTAIFPTLCGSSPFNVTCYAHIGQHGTASIEWANARTHRKADRAERNSLYHELRGIYEYGTDRVNLYIVSSVNAEWMQHARSKDFNRGR